MSKVEELKKEYSNISSGTFNKLAEGDFTPQKKYLEWMCKMWVEKNKNPVLKFRTSDLIEVVKEFDELVPYLLDKDIYSRNNTNYNKLVMNLQIARQKKDEKTFKKEDHILVLEETDQYILLMPISHRGSMKYGANTKWCTASKNNPDVFLRYINTGSLTYLVFKEPQKKSELNKIAFTLNYRQPFDGSFDIHTANNTQVYLQHIINEGINEEFLFRILTMIRKVTSIVFKEKLNTERIKQQIGLLEKLDLDFLKDLVNSTSKKSKIDYIDEVKIKVENLKNKLNQLTLISNGDIKTENYPQGD